MPHLHGEYEGRADTQTRDNSSVMLNLNMLTGWNINMAMMIF